MIYLKDAKWRFFLESPLKNEINRQLRDILPDTSFQSVEESDCPEILVGTKISCPIISKADSDNVICLSGMGPDDHVVKTVSEKGRTRVIIAGASEKAAVYGVFSFLEEIGYMFLASGMITPDTSQQIKIPEIDKTFGTTSKWRGMFVSFCMVSTSIMSLVDFSELFDNMLRMKLNRIVFYPFENEPIIDYTFKGERKLVGDISRPESGYFSYGKHWTGCFNVDEITVGREKFKPRKRVAPMEFQEVGSSDEALDKGKEFFQKIITLAAQRQIEVWLAFLPQFVSMNMVKHIKPMPRKNLHWSALVSCTDPVVRKINSARIRNIVESYKGLGGIFIGIPEGFYEDPYKESKDYIDSQLPEFQKALQLQKKYWGDHWPGDELQLKHMEADIAFSKVAVEALEDARKIKPDVKLGLITVCKAYLLTKLDEILPKDVAFCDIESRSLWTHGGAPLFLFKGMKDRECSIIPRITDDGSQAGMQFNLGLYYKDGYCRSSVENGTDGLMMQTLFIKGAEHNIKYLADGMWNPATDPQTFYIGYLKKLFGETAAPIINKAYDILEKNEEFMGGRGAANMPWNHVPPEIAVMRSFRDFDNPYHKCPLSEDYLRNLKDRSAVYKETAKNLLQAADGFDEARGLCSASGKKECSYMSIRTRAYSRHLETLVKISEIYFMYSRVFNEEDMSYRLSQILEKCREVQRLALKTASLFSECVIHTTDLAPLWMINSSMIKGTEVLCQFIENIVCYHTGREYWKPVNWSSLFGECPYPAHGVEVKPDDDSLFEPG